MTTSRMHVCGNSLNERTELFLEKLALVIEQVDSNSSRIGAAINRSIEALAPISAKTGGQPRGAREMARPTI